MIILSIPAILIIYPCNGDVALPPLNSAIDDPSRQNIFRGNDLQMLWIYNCQGACEKCLEVEFKSGAKDTACLNRMYYDNDCLFGGNFIENRTKAGQVVVSSSECLKNGNMDDIEVSFMDERSPVAKMFKVNLGNGVATAEFNTYRPNEAVMKMLFPHENEESLEYQKTNVTMRQTPPFPTNGFSLNLALRYDNEFANEFGAASENTVQNIMAHVENFFQWDSLDVNMCFNIQSIKQSNINIGGNVDLFMDKQNGLLENHIINNESTESPNLFVYLSYYTPPPGVTYTVGSAWVGSVCIADDANVNGGTQNGKGFRASISLKTSKGDLDCAETVSHEIGHNLGMEHDFEDDLGVSSSRFCETDTSYDCKNQGGIMDYHQPTTTTWTCCSNSDFYDYYQFRQPFCLIECPTPTQPPVITTPPPSPTTPPPQDCMDTRYKKWCKKQKRKERCKWFHIYNQCMKTCDCTPPPQEECKDKRNAEYCTKQVMKNRCHTKKNKKRCYETCGYCMPIPI